MHHLYVRNQLTVVDCVCLHCALFTVNHVPHIQIKLESRICFAVGLWLFSNYVFFPIIFKGGRVGIWGSTHWSP